MGRRCPICGKGMFKHKQLLRHMIECHPHCIQYPAIRHFQVSYQSGEEIRRRTKKYESKRKQKSLK